MHKNETQVQVSLSHDRKYWELRTSLKDITIVVKIRHSNIEDDPLEYSTSIFHDSGDETVVWSNKNIKDHLEILNLPEYVSSFDEASHDFEIDLDKIVSDMLERWKALNLIVSFTGNV